MTDYFRTKERNILFRRIEEVSVDAKSLDGKVSGHELICHLNNSLREICGLQSAAASSNLLLRTLGKWLVLFVIPWPESTPTSDPALSAFVGAQRPTTFEQDYAELVELLKTFERLWQDDNLQPHPVYGRLSRADWGRYMFLHVDYHLTTFGIHGDFRAPQ